MPDWVAAILRNKMAGVSARIVATLYFWVSGLDKLVNFPSGVIGEMQHFNLAPPLAYGLAAMVTLFVGSALVVHGRWAWLGAGWLAIFTLLTLPIAHNFWAMSGQDAVSERRVFFEHITLIGGLFLAAVQAHHEQQA
jgi:transmembrane protein